jgi:3-hydroxybutyryl-CoA dehydrogenase
MAAAGAPEVRRIAVIGAGTMGRGIAHVAALGGFETVVFDVSATAVATARHAIERNLAKGVERGKVGREAADQALARIASAATLEEAAAGTDLVIEAIPEDLALKIDTLRTVARAAPPHVVLATNTSALSITEMAGALARGARVVGMHFFNPVHVMRLVEVVRGLETDDDTTRLACAVAERMGKEPVVVNESPGFVTSRVNALIGNEAFFMLQEGVAGARAIDQALKLGLNHPMGPFELGDLVGLDVRLAVLEHLHAKLGEKYRPCPLLEKYVRAGRLGRKSGRGVYDYDDAG